MFSSGQFKNTVATTEIKGTPVPAGGFLSATYSLRPTVTKTKRWIAVQDTTKHGTREQLSSTISEKSDGDSSIFTIYVNYYVKVKAFMSYIGGSVSVKVPFHLTNPKENFIGKLPESDPVWGELIRSKSDSLIAKPRNGTWSMWNGRHCVANSLKVKKDFLLSSPVLHSPELSSSASQS